MEKLNDGNIMEIENEKLGWKRYYLMKKSQTEKLLQRLAG